MNLHSSKPYRNQSEFSPEDILTVFGVGESSATVFGARAAAARSSTSTAGKKNIRRDTPGGLLCVRGCDARPWLGDTTGPNGPDR